MKATLNQIAENLVKVFTNKAATTQYYSDNEHYEGVLGWCGSMSPISRQAYIKTFGKAITEEAESKARDMIAEKDAAWKRTKYAQHAQEADLLEGMPTVGGFFWADNSGLKCDGGSGLFDELHAITCYTRSKDKPCRLCCVGQIIHVSEADFSRPGLADELVQTHDLKGFCRSEDVDDSESMNDICNNPEKLATFYTVGALVVSPSGRYYLIDSEGYDYARYIYLPLDWADMYANEVESIKAEEDARKAEEDRQAAEEKAKRLAEYRSRCAKWLPLMRNVDQMEQDGKASARKLDNARKANILAMCAAAFPGVKFSVHIKRGWGASFELTWHDGPTLEEFNEKTDLDLFCRSRDTFNGWDDSTDVIYAEFTEFADLTMGSNCGDIDTNREMSKEARASLLAKIFSAVPAADIYNKYGHTEAHTYTDKEAEAVAAALGVDVSDLFKCGYTDNAEIIARRAWDNISYTMIATPEPTDQNPGKAHEGATDTPESDTITDEQQATPTADTITDGQQATPTADTITDGQKEDTQSPSTASDSSLCAAGEITETATTDNAEDVAEMVAAYRLELLRSAADYYELFKDDGKHITAVNARLSALSVCGVDVADLVQSADYKADYYARQRAAVVLTDDEFSTLYGFSKEEQPEDCGKVWKFARGVENSIDYELYEIREFGGVYSVILNVCDMYPQGHSFPLSFNTYREAAATLARFRPGVRLIAEPAA